jgi:CHAT domain-containing protein
VPDLDSAATLIALADGAADDLPGALREVRSLERRYARVERVSERDSVLGAIARRADRGRILHIAAHAQVNDDSPWQSGFLLGEHATASSGGGARYADAAVELALVAAGRRASVLRAWEIARTHLPYGLAVLAGCETAGGRATNGEGVLGLTSAFLSAGVPVVVSSLWPVDDRATARLMSRFYDRLAAGDPVATALRVAQLSIRNDARTAHPFYWAGFTVVGDGSRVIRPLPSRRIDGVWFAASGLTIMLVGMALFTRRRTREKRGRAALDEIPV